METLRHGPNLVYQRQNDTVSREVVRRWMAKKRLERKEREKAEALLKKERERRKAEALEKERENFRKWLVHKKKEEEKKMKNLQEMAMAEQRRREEEREKRRHENELSYQLWLKKKEQIFLNRKIQQEMMMAQMMQMRQQRMLESQKAFCEWCQNVKTRPKPIPCWGVQNMKSSVSVSSRYVSRISDNLSQRFKSKTTSFVI